MRALVDGLHTVQKGVTGLAENNVVLLRSDGKFVPE
jgi:hypothetical protein